MSTLALAFPVLWEDVDKFGLEGVVEVQSSDLPRVGAQLGGLISLLNEMARLVVNSDDTYREVVLIQLFGVRVDKHQHFETLIPGLLGGGAVRA
ncbi:hypothetical protein PI125_g11293 [Phytophthora idaei]|nr:hypothetical protein PI125_g11293 [Phytophthora idaei]KAG3137805.1 hypothetical protein PI126_g17208 [Phytophthora idaei]